MDSNDPDTGADFPWKKVVSTAVHDIRTPLSSLCTSIEILKMNRLDSGQAHKLMSMMNRQIEAISKHLDTLANQPADYLETSPVTHE